MLNWLSIIIAFALGIASSSLIKKLILKLYSHFGQLYLFSWDYIPGNDNGRLIKFLTQKFGIDWVKTAKIEKIDDGKTIKVSTEKNSLSLKLNDEKTKVNLKIDDGRLNEFIAKTESGKVNIYEKGYKIKISRKNVESIKDAKTITKNKKSKK